MPLRHLFGPVSAHFADQNLREARSSGACLAFNEVGDTDVRIGPGDRWEDVAARCPAGWQPDCVVLNLPYTTVPDCLWSAPVPFIGLAGDWNLLFHHYRRCLARCDLVLTDTQGVEVLSRDGVAHACKANLSGCERAYLEAEWPDGTRDIDVLFVGNLNHAVHRERMSCLARLAALGDRWRVVIESDVAGADYRALMARSRIVFNRSSRGGCNRRTFAAAAAGALLFHEAGNREVPAFLADRRECVFYTDDDLESLLRYYLEHEDERRALALAARRRVKGYSFGTLWEEALRQVERHWALAQDRSRKRRATGGAENLLARTWQALASKEGRDPSLLGDLRAAAAAEPGAAALHNAVGLIGALAAQDGVAAEAAGNFRQAVAADPLHPVAALNLVEALCELRHIQPALAGAHRALAFLQRGQGLDLARLDAPHYPPAFDTFRVEWERAAWENAGRPAAEARAKAELLRWRLHTLLAELTGDLVNFHEAVVARPDLPVTRAMLGCALARAGRPVEAVAHLRHAVAAQPFDAAAARALYQALLDSGDAGGAAEVARQRRLLLRAAPRWLPAETWYTDPPSSGEAIPVAVGSPVTPTAVVPAREREQRARVSLCLIVKNEETNLPDCLASANGLFDEVVVVDTGSTDRTKEIALALGAQVFDFPWVDSFSAARNECLKRATGDWIFWLDADDRIDAPDRDRLRALFTGLKDENAAYVVKCVCDGEPGAGPTVVDHVRLFRNRPDVRWEHRVHEQILPSLRRTGTEVRWAEAAVRHVGYSDRALRRKKLERDLRLLELERAELNDHPFTLFNLGSVYQEIGDYASAVPVLQKSLAQSHAKDSIVRKLYALLTHCHRSLGQRGDALGACQAGLGHYPDDAELLFLAAVLREEAGDLAGAETALTALLTSRPGAHFASVAAGLRGYKARCKLAEVLLKQGRAAEAEAQWRLAVRDEPRSAASWLGLGQMLLGQQRFAEAAEAAGRLEALKGAEGDGTALRARIHMAKGAFAEATTLLSRLLAAAPQWLYPRVLLSHALLQEGHDFGAAEKALLDVLELDPDNAEAKTNLDVLRRRRAAAKDQA
jgi:tetratricopeptide (TPR) repeat protein